MSYLYIGNQKVSPIITRDYRVVNISSTTPTVTLSNYTVYDAGTLTSLTITNPSPIPTDFITQINFISGSTPTIINVTNFEWFGDNVSETAGFVPRVNCEYSIIIYYTGTKFRGIIQGSSL